MSSNDRLTEVLITTVSNPVQEEQSIFIVKPSQERTVRTGEKKTQTKRTDKLFANT